MLIVSSLVVEAYLKEKLGPHYNAPTAITCGEEGLAKSRSCRTKVPLSVAFGLANKEYEGNKGTKMHSELMHAGLLPALHEILVKLL